MKELLSRFNGVKLQIGILAILIVIVGFLLLFSLNTNPSAVPNTSPETNSQTLTPEEKSYPEATPQPYITSAVAGTGTLIVTSPIDNVRVMIDDGDAESPGTMIYPIQITPFKITDIPAGKHFLRAAKKGYNFIEQTFEITSDQVTRIEIELDEL